MEYEFTRQFAKDLKSYTDDKSFLQTIGKRVNETNRADSINEIHGLKDIRGTTAHFRFKIKTNKAIYRIGIKLLKNVIWFACIDNNKKRFYKRFP